MRAGLSRLFMGLIPLFLAACHSDGVNEEYQNTVFGTGEQDEENVSLLVDGIQITFGELGATDDGFMHQRVGVSVTANGGQPAPDGTLVRLRIIDSIIAYGNDGSIIAGSNQLVSETPLDGAFNSVITRQFEPLYADGAQVLILTGDFADRGRVVSAVTGPNSMDVNRSYSNSAEALRYWVGKSHYGITVLGADESALPDGVATTEGGKASVIVRYPRYDCVTGDGECLKILGYGCGSYDDDGRFHADENILIPGNRAPKATAENGDEGVDNSDNRAYSKQVILYAEIASNLSSDAPRHVAVTPDFCFF